MSKKLRVRSEELSSDGLIAQLARRQYGIVSAKQLRGLGLSWDAMAWRVQRGRLHRLYRGVFAVGHVAPSRETTWMAALLAVGGDAVLAGEAAAEIWGLWRDRRARRLEILVPRRHHGLPGARVREVRLLPSDHVTVRHGFPVTTVARTLLDLAAERTPHEIAALMHEAAFRRRLDIAGIRRVVERSWGQRASVLRAALDLHLTGSAGLRSELERRFLELLEAAGLPMPLVNTRVRVAGGRLEVDFVWPDARIVVEIDGSGHRRARTRREDAARDRALVAAGYRVIRLRPDQLEAAVDSLAAVLA